MNIVNESLRKGQYKVRFAWQLSVSSVLLLMFHCRVTVMWRLHTGFLRRTTLPLMESPAYTLTGLSSMNRVCFQCVDLNRKESFYYYCGALQFLTFSHTKSTTISFAACNTKSCTQTLLVKYLSVYH